jgi:hypothetical protein
MLAGIWHHATLHAATSVSPRRLNLLNHQGSGLAARPASRVPRVPGHAAASCYSCLYGPPVLVGSVEGVRQGYRATRSELGGLVPPHVIGAALKDFRAEGGVPLVLYGR